MNKIFTLAAVRTSGCMLVGAVILSGCSSKPGEADIAKELTESLQCPLLEVADVKKVDGIARGSSGYEVSYNYKINLVGGGDATVKLLPEWAALTQMRPRLAREVERASSRAGSIARERDGMPTAQSVANAPADPLEEKALLKLKKGDARIAELLPCQTAQATFALQHMAAAMEAAMVAGAPEMTVPVGLQVHGSGVMVKAESGWHFENRPLATMVSDSTVVLSAKTYKTPPSTAAWGDFTHPEGFFVAEVPALGQCTSAKLALNPSEYGEQCTFSSTQTDMEVWVSKREKALDGASDDPNQLLDEQIARIAEHNKEQVVSVSSVQGLPAKDFVTSSPAGARNVRLMLTNSSWVEAIAKAKKDKPGDKAEREHFVKSVRPSGWEPKPKS